MNLRGLNTVNVWFLSKNLSQCFSIAIFVTTSIVCVGNNKFNTLIFAANPSVIFVIYYELQNSLQVGTSASFFSLSTLFLVIMPANYVSTKERFHFVCLLY